MSVGAAVLGAGAEAWQAVATTTAALEMIKPNAERRVNCLSAVDGHRSLCIV